MTKKKMLTIKEVAQRKGVAEVTVRKWLRLNRFPNAQLLPTPMGQYWGIPLADLAGVEPGKAGRPKKSTKKQVKHGSCKNRT